MRAFPRQAAARMPLGGTLRPRIVPHTADAAAEGADGTAAHQRELRG